MKIDTNNKFTKLQKEFYKSGTTNHEEHNSNPDYWDILLKEITSDRSIWSEKSALDFACGKGRNVANLLSLANWKRADGVDISEENINFCKQNFDKNKTNWYCNNGFDLSELISDSYDFVMSTIALQHIPVYSIRKNLIKEILRVIKPGGIFSFQMGFGENLEDAFNRPKSSYFEEAVYATGTNSKHDVRVQNEQEIIQDLKEIGFSSVKTVIRDSYSDHGHPKWVYVNANKKKS
jgi:SAM-dependent methyltransferase